MNLKTATTDETRRIKAALSHGDWRYGKWIAAMANVPVRKIRAVAQATGAIISSQRGYKLTRFATDEEIDIAIRDLASRAAHLNQRAAHLSRVLHRRRNGELL